MKEVTYDFPDGRSYTGEIDNGKINGKGAMTFSNGDIYEGEWSDGNMNGKGTYRKYDATLDGYVSVYYGDFAKNKIEGRGRCEYHDGSIYEGQWQNGMRTGVGACWWKDGSFFWGLWRYDAMLRGTLRFPSGDIYDGEILNGFPHGFGKMFNADRTSVVEGVFDKGAPVDATVISSDGSVSSIKRGE